MQVLKNGQSSLQSTQRGSGTTTSTKHTGRGIDPHGTRREDVNNRYKQIATPMQVLKKGQSSPQSTQKEALTPMFLRRDNQAHKAHREAVTPVFLSRGNHVYKAHREAVTPVFLRRGNHVHKAHREVVGQSRLQSTQKEALTSMGQEGTIKPTKHTERGIDPHVLKGGQSSLQCRDPMQCMFLKEGTIILQSYKQVATPMHVLKKGQSSLRSTQKESLTPMFLRSWTSSRYLW